MGWIGRSMGWKLKSMGWIDEKTPSRRLSNAKRRTTVAVRINCLPYSAHGLRRGGRNGAHTDARPKEGRHSWCPPTRMVHCVGRNVGAGLRPERFRAAGMPPLLSHPGGERRDESRLYVAHIPCGRTRAPRTASLLTRPADISPAAGRRRLFLMLRTAASGKKRTFVHKTKQVTFHHQRKQTHVRRKAMPRRV